MSMMCMSMGMVQYSIWYDTIWYSLMQAMVWYDMEWDGTV